ncbi:MAG: hypothetical protein WBH47_17640 [Streptosporangiaceae bacterium]
MNHQLLCSLAEQRRAELDQTAVPGTRLHRGRRPVGSLRERAGWTLVEVGLRLASQPARDGQLLTRSAG